MKVKLSRSFKKPEKMFEKRQKQCNRGRKKKEHKTSKISKQLFVKNTHDTISNKKHKKQ